jgi:hypothetical protein
VRFEKGGERGMRKAAQGIEKEKGGERGPIRIRHKMVDCQRSKHKEEQWT